MGRDVAIDGSDLPAYANGQRYVSTDGPERERYSDPDASWGHRSAVSTRKGGGFYGYKVHAAVDVATGLPLAWTVETASAAETNFALPLIDTVRERGFAVGTAIMDKGYDNGPIHDGCMERDVAPVTALRKTGRVKAGANKPPTCEHGEWTFSGGRLQAQGDQVAMPHWRVQARLAVGQGGSPPPADPARVRTVAEAVPEPWRSRSRVRALEARVGAAAAPRSRDRAGPAPCRLDDPRQARLRACARARHRAARRVKDVEPERGSSARRCSAQACARRPAHRASQPRVRGLLLGQAVPIRQPLRWRPRDALPPFRASH